MPVSPGNLPLEIIRDSEFDSFVLQLRNDTVTVTGSLSPDVTGDFVPSGTYNSSQLFILAGSPSTFMYVNPVAGCYVIARTLTDAALTDYWSQDTPDVDEPSGVYSANGAVTGVATANDNPVDLTGYGVEAQVRRTSKSTNIVLDLAPFISDPTVGEITIPSLTSTQTKALTLTGDFRWDLMLTNTGNRFGPYVVGKFTISDLITKSITPDPT